MYAIDDLRQHGLSSQLKKSFRIKRIDAHIYPFDTRCGKLFGKIPKKQAISCQAHLIQVLQRSEFPNKSKYITSFERFTASYSNLANTQSNEKFRLVWQIVNQGAKGQDLRGADLRGVSLCGVDLRGVDLRGANLREADLCGANLKGADLRRSTLNEANLRQANLAGAILYEASLVKADLRGANLRGVELRRADLSQAILSEPNLHQALCDHTTNWPANFDPVEHGAIVQY